MRLSRDETANYQSQDRGGGRGARSGALDAAEELNTLPNTTRRVQFCPSVYMGNLAEKESGAMTQCVGQAGCTWSTRVWDMLQ